VLNEWVTHYNTGRPHSALVQACPIRRNRQRCCRSLNPTIGWWPARSCASNQC
jgi:hypothetical protein